MLTGSFFAFLHFAAAFGIACTLFYERLTFAKALSFAEAKRLQLCDRWYGIFSGVILIVGFLRVFYFEKGSEFYFSNPYFAIKLGLFMAIGLLSVYPTVKFIRWGKELKEGKPPAISDREFSAISLILNLELGLLAVLLLTASLMAKGI